MPVFFRSELFTSYNLTIIYSEAYSRRYEKLIKYSNPCMLKYNRKKLLCWKCVARKLKFDFVYLHFDPLRLNSSIAWLSVNSAVQRLCIRFGFERYRVQLPAPARIFMFDFLFCYFFCPKLIICHTFLQFLLQCYFFKYT